MVVKLSIMEEKLEKILLDLNIGYITVKVAKRKILRLFSVVGQSEKLVCRLHSMRKNCREYRYNKKTCKTCPHNVRQTN